MSDVRKFKFVSPGIFLREIDNSQLPAKPTEVGPVIIGRSKEGPALRPYKVDSFSSFVDVFGTPVAGGGGGDYFREGNIAGPTYGPYAAQAYLDAQVGPVTYVRMLGAANPSKTATGDAGYVLTKEFDSSPSQDTRWEAGGTYGLFIIPSASDVSAPGTQGRGGPATSGSLAAIFYCNSGSSMQLSGAARTVGDETAATEATIPASGSCIVLESQSGITFTGMVQNDIGNTVLKTEFNFDRNSEKYIRKVFNTNPTLVNTAITDTTLLQKGEGTYWLGETYDSHLFNMLESNSGDVYGYFAAINSGSGTQDTAGLKSWADRNDNYINPQTGWFFCQDVTTDTASYDACLMTKLFKFHARDAGESAQENYKISLQDIRSSTNAFNDYGTFTVVVRAANDSDAKPVIIERFSECDINPQSQNYVGRKIGDRYVEWSYEDTRMREYGEFKNNSEIVRIEINPDLNAADPRLLPFGVFGPPRPPGFAVLSQSCNGPTYFSNIVPLLGPDATVLATGSYGADGAVASYSYAEGSGSCASTYQGVSPFGVTAPYNVPVNEFVSNMSIQTSVGDSDGYAFTASNWFPSTQTRLSASDHGVGSPKSAYWGLQTNYWSSARTSTTYDIGYRDYVRGLPLAESRFDTLAVDGAPTGMEYSWIFTLDDLVLNGVGGTYWASGSRQGVARSASPTGVIIDEGAGSSITSASYKEVIETYGFNRFTSPLYGGFDGFNIKEKDPFRDGYMDSSATALNNYAYNTVKRAINTVADPEFVEMNMLTAPGIVNENLTQAVLNVCEDRGDALGIIDIRGVYQPFTENASDFKTRVTATSLDQCVSDLKDRSINSSYGCTYYPWVQIQDTLTGQFLWSPPSVAAIGTFASSERKSEVWFAPAGFNRGGLSKGKAAGIPVVSVTEKLVSSERDKLYEANINPLATFPSEGIVVFGQKTLQVTPSALDRINVRRLMVFIKKEISRIASGILFDQNVRATWQRFTSQANPLLESVRARMGLTEFRVVLDETTTTPDLIDRNIMYAKIFLKPARAIEFIAIDFNITRTGAAFVD